MSLDGITVAPPKVVAVAKEAHLRLYFSLILLALVVASVSGAGLAWDGSYVLFKVLDTQAPFVVHNRWFVVPLQWPVLLASGYTSDLTILQSVFNLAYGLIPLIALAACWWIVRDKAPSLFVWPALGIGLVTLPGQLCFVSDANITLQLFWPIMLGVLTGLRRPQVYLVMLLAVIVLLDHPVALGLFGVAAGLAFLRGWRYPAQRLFMWCWMFGFLALSALTLLKFSVAHNSYEDEQLSLAVLERQYQAAVSGLPLMAMLCTFAAALMILANPFFKSSQNSDNLLAVRIIELTSLLLVAVLFFLWGRSATLWEGGIDFRLWAAVFTMPLLLMATLDSFRHDKIEPEVQARVWKHRSGTIKLLGAIFLLVLTAQSLSWLGQTNRLREAMAQSNQTCVTTDSVNWTIGTVLGHWSLTPYSLLLGGNKPQKIVLPEASCADERISTGAQLTQWEWRRWRPSWFDTSVLSQQLVAEKQTTLAKIVASAGCRFSMSSGWYEREQNGTFWWQWNAGQSRLEVNSTQAVELVLRGELKTIQTPNEVQVVLNGKPVAALEVTSEDMKGFQPLPLALKAGANQLEFISRNPAAVTSKDKRNLAIAVGNLKLTDRNNLSICELGSA